MILKIIFLNILLYSIVFCNSKLPVSIYHEGDDEQGKKFRENITLTILFSENLYEISQESDEYEDIDFILVVSLKTSDIWESNVGQTFGKYSHYKIDFLLIGNDYLPYHLHKYSGIISADSISYSIEYKHFESEFDVAIENFKNWNEINDTDRLHRIMGFLFIIFLIGIVVFIKKIIEEYKLYKSKTDIDSKKYHKLPSPIDIINQINEERELNKGNINYRVTLKLFDETKTHSYIVQAINENEAISKVKSKLVEFMDTNNIESIKAEKVIH